MPPTRRVAILLDPHRLDRHLRQILAGVVRFAEHAGHWRCTFDPKAADHLPGPYHGLIASATNVGARRIVQSRVPAVFVTWRACHIRTVVRVVENRPAAGRLAAAHFLEAGYRSFGYLGLLKNATSRMERRGLLDWLHWRGRTLDSLRIWGMNLRTFERWRQLPRDLDQWLDRLQPPVGVFCTSDALAHTLGDRAQRKGLRVPDDVGLIGAGNDPTVCQLNDPPLTSIDLHGGTIGARAAELLDHLMDGGLRRPGNVLIPPSLVPRRSSDRARVDDPLVAQALYWIRTHSNEAIRAPDVARAVGLGQSQLARRIRRGRGRSIVREILLARLDHAKALLQTGDDSPAAVAHLAGFPSRWSMARVFRQELAMTPTQYRRRHKRPPPPGRTPATIVFLPPPPLDEP